MNSNGRNRNNTFEGDVFVDGDLTVTGTINGGGGGGGVNNPMTEDLQAGGYAIYNISEITGYEGLLPISTTIDLQDNNIEGVNTIKLDKITTKNPEDYFIDCDGKILNNANAFTLNNGLSFSASIVPEVNHVLTVEAPGTLIGYKKAVFNPVEEPVDMNSNNIDHCATLDVHFIKDTVENKVKFISVVHTLQPLYCFEDIVMNYKRIYYCNSLIAAHNESGLGLDMIPATVGLPGQVLARDPLFNPADPLTYKLVWANQSSGGGVTNPMTANLFANDFNIYQANILEGKNILVMAGGGGIACNAGGSSVPVTWLLAIKKSTSPFYQTFNTDYITPQTIAGVTIDSKWEDGTTDTKISLQTPILNINNSTNLSPTNITITGNIQITQGSGYIHGNNLIVRGRTSANVPTNLTLEGVTTSINSTTLNITSTANVIAGNTNFTGIVKTNNIQPYTGTSINITATDTNISNRLNVLTNRSSSIGVRTTIFKTYGPMPNVNINVVPPTNPPVKLNSIIAAQKGDYIIPSNGFVNGDKFIITMYGLLTTVGSGSLNIYLYVGVVLAVSFSVVNVASAAQPCKFTFEIDCTVSGNDVNLGNGTALLSVERNNTSIRYSAGSIGSLVPNNGLSNSIDIYVSQSATQTSNFTPLSYTIEQL